VPEVGRPTTGGSSDRISPGLAGAAALMIFAVLGSAITGLIREIAIAREFGTSGELSAYVAAFGVPDFVYFLIAGGALRTGFIPVFTDYTARGRSDQAWKTFSTLFCLLLLAGTAVVILGMALAPWLAHVVAPGLEPRRIRLCGELMRIMFPAQVFFLLGGLMMGALNAQRHFLWPGLGPIVYNLAIITAAVWLAKDLGIYALAAAVVVGALVGNFALQVAPLLARGARFMATLDLYDEGVRRVWELALPIVFGLAVAEINFVITKAIASTCGESGVAVLNYANRLMKLPVRVWGAGIAIALFPSLSLAFAAGKEDDFRRDLSFGLRNTIFLTVPSAVLLAVLSDPIVRLLLQWKNFSAADTAAVGTATLWFAPAIVGIGCQYILTRGFYARHDTRTPVLVGVLTVLACTVLSLWLRGPMAVNGLALATSVTALANGAILAELLRRRCGGIDGARLWWTSLWVGACSAVSGAVAYGLLLLAVTRFGTMAPAARLAAVIVPAIGGAGVYVLLYTLVGGTEAASAMRLVLRRFGRKGSSNGSTEG